MTRLPRFHFEGATAVVTGAASGIGEALAPAAHAVAFRPLAARVAVSPRTVDSPR